MAATVNYATEKATVTVPDGYDPARLIAEGEKDRLHRRAPTPHTAAIRPIRRRPGRRRTGDPELASLRHRLRASTVLTVLVIAMAMIPALQFTYWQWASLTLAAPVIVWAAWPFHRAAWANLRHGTATMDTLISREPSRRSRGRCTHYFWVVPARRA